MKTITASAKMLSSRVPIIFGRFIGAQLRFLKNEGTFQFRPSPNRRLKRQRLIPQSVGIDGSHQSHMFFTDCLKQFDAIKIDH